jgi:oxygen-independent coproporphyrinogen-3 oxidase
MSNSLPLPPLALYVHLPWCVRKCPYCDFNSHAVRDGVPEQAYVEALLRDLEFERPAACGRSIDTLFIGGGTPSLFSPEAITRLLVGMRERIALADDAEITLEANPGTVDIERFKGFRVAGVNRLSIGIQSFDDIKLKALGRIHGSDGARRAVEAARAAGFENFNFDLMFGLPDQTVDEAVADVRAALAFDPPHLSVYQLTLEPNTAFHVQPPHLPDDERLWEMQQRIEAELAQAGYRHYEVSAYARPGHECRHNLNYWQFGDYLGIGAGAHGKITADGDAQGHARVPYRDLPMPRAQDAQERPAGGRMPGATIVRRWKVKHPADYLAKAGLRAAIGGEQRLANRDLPFEFLLNALRLDDGFTPALFEQRTGLPLTVIEKPLVLAESRGLLVRETDGIRASARGARLLNDLLLLFLPEPERKAVRT